MIHHISGNLTEKAATHVVVEAAGVGYFINISLQTYEHLPSEGQVKILTHLVVREDAHLLYGFVTDVERQMFRLLINVSGVGANTARLILSALAPAELTNAIASGNVGLITKVKGIGAKTAQRLILELRDKVSGLQVEGENNLVLGNTIKSEALSGLTVLGFDKNKSEKAVEKVLKDQPDIAVEELIKQAIKVLF